MITQAACRAAIEFPRPGMFLVPAGNHLSIAARCQMLGVWRLRLELGGLEFSAQLNPLVECHDQIFPLAILTPEVN